MSGRRLCACPLTALALACALVGSLAPAAGAAPRRPDFAVSDTPSSTRPHWACPEGACLAIVDPHHRRGVAPFARARSEPEGGGEEGGLDPQDLRAAYGIPASGGAGETIALVEGFAYKQAEADLAKYRSHYGLAPCSAASGCYTAVSGKGEAPHYTKNGGWEDEEALDLDMASAACPECHLLLVDTEGESWDRLGRSVNTAASLGATEISNSYGLAEETCEAECAEAAGDFDHPGVLITVSSGDEGYDNYLVGRHTASYPADLPDVIAVGGTALRRAPTARGWSESVWFEPRLGLGSGSGCTPQPKPSWQTDAACPGRTDNDAAAVGACETPVSVYDSLEGGWTDLCGTSVSSPLLAGIEAHASAYARSLPGAEAFYEDPAALHDVTVGKDGRCSGHRKYLCRARVGYDGPTGEGTPDGPLLLSG